MLDIINFIESDIKALKGSNRELYLKLELLKKIAIYLSQNQVEGKLDKIIPLVDMNTGYSEYRLINDCESDNKDLWIEYSYKDSMVRLSPGDFLLKMK